MTSEAKMKLEKPKAYFKGRAQRHDPELIFVSHKLAFDRSEPS
jgi:hypothetical protein